MVKYLLRAEGVTSVSDTLALRRFNDLSAEVAAARVIAADKMAAIAGLVPLQNLGNNLETSGDLKSEEDRVSDCLIGSPGWNRTNDQRINSPTLYR